ncbi:hypothetical protein Cgig2_009190 [Carnegiea gigantea]|uniref:Piwi domain-containing protein n=1 Tax=Carnegiea gigantea TaxID=171969 RepID=A0A9Q1JJ71_9CARY|nr:hypothetical protein Cgig2_009190 [Carnegiea gigantea]
MYVADDCFYTVRCMMLIYLAAKREPRKSPPQSVVALANAISRARERKEGLNGEGLRVEKDAMHLGGLNSPLAVEQNPSIPLVSKVPTIILGMDVSHGSPGHSGNERLSCKELHDWISHGEDLSADGKEAPSTSPPTRKAPNPLPTDEQQHITDRPAVAPAIAGRAPPKASVASTLHNDSFHGLLSLLLSVLASFLLLQHLEPEIRLVYLAYHPKVLLLDPFESVQLKVKGLVGNIDREMLR